MTTNRQFNSKRDANEADIVKTLENLGCSVVRLVNPLDLLVGYMGVTKLCEVKASEKSTFSKKQKEFIPTWRGGFTLLITTEDCENLVKSVKKEVLAINKSEYCESNEWEKGLI